MNNNNHKNKYPNIKFDTEKTKHKEEITLIRDESDRLIGFHISHSSGNR